MLSLQHSCSVVSSCVSQQAGCVCHDSGLPWESLRVHQLLTWILHIGGCVVCVCAFFLSQAGTAGSNQQGVLPALFGFQLGPGASQVSVHNQHVCIMHSDVLGRSVAASRVRLAAADQAISRLGNRCSSARSGGAHRHTITCVQPSGATGHEQQLTQLLLAAACGEMFVGGAAGQGYVEALTPEQQHQVGSSLRPDDGGGAGGLRQWFGVSGWRQQPQSPHDHSMCLLCISVLTSCPVLSCAVSSVFHPALLSLVAGVPVTAAADAGVICHHVSAAVLRRLASQSVKAAAACMMAGPMGAAIHAHRRSWLFGEKCVCVSAANWQVGSSPRSTTYHKTPL